MLGQPLNSSGPLQDLHDATTGAYRLTLHACGELFKCICCPLLTCSLGPVAIVEQGFVGVLTRFGVFERSLPPGIYAYNVLSQKIDFVCMKMQTFETPRQSAMTRDNLSVHVDAVTFVTVVHPYRALFQVEDYRGAVKVLSASTLLRVIAEHDLQQIFADRGAVNARLTQTMQEKTAGWGLHVAGVELRDISIPDGMQRAIAQIAEATREADAKVIVARGQRQAADVFVRAAEEMEVQPASIQLQWFETLRQIASEKNSTIIVPSSLFAGSGSGLASFVAPLAGALGGGAALPRPAAEAASGQPPPCATSVGGLGLGGREGGGLG